MRGGVIDGPAAFAHTDDGNRDFYVLADHLTQDLASVLDRPDLRVIAGERRIGLDPALPLPFRVGADGMIVLGAPCLAMPAAAPVLLRHALELVRLLEVAPGEPVLAGLCAARTAALFAGLDGPAAGRSRPAWHADMAADVPPEPARLADVWSTLSPLQPPVTPPADGAVGFGGLRARLTLLWSLLGPAESLMAEGGDARLAIDPATGLNHYGCSHRPRPWAVTFASSTASSLSERGFAGAEAARLRLIRGELSGDGARVRAEMVEDVRRQIACHYRMTDAECVVLAPSGTDCELQALAMATLGFAGHPVSNILLAPEETGSGVPLAAKGCHFANDTALGAQVTKGQRIAGFPDDTQLLSVPLRLPDGALRAPADIDRACDDLARRARAAGRHVLMHRLDLSKTGLLAPGLEMLDGLAEDGSSPDVPPPDVPLPDVVVDACQARLDPARVRAYLDRGWMVMITGSKFFTGPPFCGALLLPAGVAARLDHGSLPVGLADYSHRGAWPPCAAAGILLPGENLGLVLRWYAALAEMTALQDIPRAVVRDRLDRFLDALEGAIDADPDLCRLVVPAPARPPLADAWDDRTTIMSFFVRDPHAAKGVESFVPLGLDAARALYRWLNTDLSRLLPGPALDGGADGGLGGLLCHVGQPVPLPHTARADGPAGALRLSAGARLISGEPSHGGLVPDRRMDCEIRDGLRVLAKIGLILRHWAVLAAADPVQTYAPLPAMDTGVSRSRP
ncbi:conserved hypothetical protein [Gluconacetobacter diazotrophicus PA1 5]|uniref:hypothetical protein n=1 Tax=Gluconacetobacter diazotrophicus TaxID=33996 RepID=UPI000173C156|nr:hypothetical protein [Gluconacetobacter diazotrophicus]ACI51595.1 conserved hypothetical protein [Gluconacetobacter diazotrophicus PA1 5]